MALRTGTHKYKDYPSNVKTPDERQAFDSGGQAAVDKVKEKAKQPAVAAPANQSDSESARLNRQNNTGFTASENVEQKTNKPESDTPQEVVSSGISNVLNDYRSVTYSFTMSVLDSDDVSSPESYREGDLKYVILKSGGKGFVGITKDVRGIERVVGQEEITTTERKRVGRDNWETTKKTEKKDITEMDYSAKEIVEGFNAESPGRFDMYIENVDIETLMTPSDDSNSTLPTNIKFDVLEPYSMNGFIEAMHVAAIAAGYESYLGAVFLLKIEFWGYPDDTDLPEPELIEESSRYFPMNLTGIEVDVSELGTKYRCNAVPLGERAFGQPSKINKPIQMAGSTVGEILDDFIKNFNKQIQDSDEKSKSDLPRNFDTYEIKFPTMSEDGVLVDSPSNKDIRDKKIGAILKDNLLYNMVDPGDTNKPNAYKVDGSKQPSAQQQAKQPDSIKYIPNQTVINFAQGMSINDVIASVIRDSDYVKDILAKMGKEPNIPDEFGFLDYFIITTEIKDKKEKNPNTKKPYQIFTYIVTPYKVHYTRVPGYGQTDVKEETLKRSCNRTYNYIYTGQNIDVMSFKLNFNNLYFEAVPADMGNKPTVGSKDTAGPAGTTEVKNSPNVQAPGERGRSVATEVPKAPVRVIPSPITAYTGATAAQPKNDPYSLLARGMHESVINSHASMITGELDILGDPFYLVSGGIGNNRPKRKKKRRGKTDDGDADHTYGSVLILINFRNPSDINRFEDGGMVKFDSNRVPFSGAYQVNKATSSFRDGAFKQKLEIMRMPGQVLDSNLRDSDPADARTTKPDATDQVTPDETRATNPSQRMDSNTAAEQLTRGLPSAGRPSELSNFTNATGGLGGTTPSLLNQTAGSIADAGSPTSKNLIVGQPLPSPNDISSNIRLNASGLVNLSQKSLENSALLASAANVLTGNLSIERAVGSLGGSLINSAINYARDIPNIGSGIGKGATVSLDATPATAAADLNANQLKEGLDFDTSKLSLSSVGNIASSISSKTIDAAKGIGDQAKNLVGGIGDKIKSLTALPSDPTGAASEVGLDSNSLSGLRGALQSKLPSQINDMIKNVPEDVNLSKAAAAGLVLDYIPANKISNIPATPPYTTAPIPEIDKSYVDEVVKKSGMVGLMNLYGVSSPDKLSTNLVPSDLIASVKNKISNVEFNPLANIF